MGKSDTGRKLAMGALLAGVAGYVAGILTAPKSGKETRADVKRAATRATREAEKRLKELYNDLSELVDEGRTQASHMKSKAKVEYEDVLALAEDSKLKIKELLSAVRNGDAEDPDLQAAIKDAEKLKTHLKSFVKRGNETKDN